MMEILFYIITGLAIGALIAYLGTKSGLNTLHQKELLLKADENNILSRQNSGLQARVEAQANSLDEVRKAMVDTFKSAASDALTQNNKQFIDLAKSQLETHVKEAEGNLDERKSAIAEMLKPVKESIDSYKKRIEDCELLRSIGWPYRGAVQSVQLAMGAYMAPLEAAADRKRLVESRRTPRRQGPLGVLSTARR